MKLRAIGLFLAATSLAAVVRAAADETPTVITSESGEMVSSETESTFTFRNNVAVTGTNIKITCDQLVVVANRTGDAKATIGKQDKFKSLVATGHVRILQNDREAVCDRAEVFPGEDKVVLTGTPDPKVRFVNEKEWSIEGPVIELLRGERRARVMKPKIIAPPLKDLGYEKEPEKKADAAPKSEAPVAPPTK